MSQYPALATQRTDANRLAEQIVGLQQRQADLEVELAAAGDRLTILRLRRQLAQVASQLAAARPAADAARAAYRAALDALPGALDPEVPCALLPVRLETRIRARTDGQPGDELLCRVYPDDIHTDAHERTLSDTEIALVQHYWRQRWGAEATGGPGADGLRRAAWQQLATRLTPPRATWAVRMLTPTNLPSTAGVQPVFPPAPLRTEAGRASYAAGLPDRWVVGLWRDGQRIGEARGDLIPRPLPVAPAPDPDDSTAPAGWLVDLSAALAAGMAVLVRPDPPTALDRVDLVTATGVRGADDATESGQVLRDLLDAHQFAPGLTGPGLDLLPQGTPTNNTPQVRSPRRRDGTGTDPSGSPAAARSDGSDAALLAAALGLPDRDQDPAGPSERFVFGRLPGADTVDQRNAAAMATVLWPATWGYYLHQFMPGIAELGPAADLSGWRRFVVDTVRGQGPLPALRVRDQPYGVLPVLPVADWQPWPDQPELLVATLHGGPPGRAADADLRVGWDLDASGSWTGGWTASGSIPVEADATGLDVALADLDGDGRSDAVVAVTVTAASAAAYRVGRALDAVGVPGQWSDPAPVPADPAASSIGVAMANLGDHHAMVVAVQAPDPTGDPRARPVTKVVVGAGLDADGGVASWSAGVIVPGSAGAGRLVGAAAGTLASEAVLVLAWVRAGVTGDEVVYRVGRKLAETGEVGRWGAARSAPVPAGWQVAGSGVALAHRGGPAGAVDVVVHLAAQAGDQPVGSYLVGIGLALDGRVDRWAGPFNTGALAETPGLQVLATGVAAGPLGRRHQVGTATAGGLVDLLGRARSSWSAGVPQVPRVGRTADPTDDLLDLFARDAVSATVRARGLLGSKLLLNSWLAADIPTDQPRLPRELWQATRTLLADWGLIDPAAPDADEPAGKPRLGLSAFEEVATEIPVPLADARTPDALAAVAQAPPEALHQLTFSADAALLDRLVRHAALQAWADAGLLLRPPDAAPDRPPSAEPELVDLADLTDRDPVTPVRTPTAWRHLDEQTFSAGHPWAGRRVREGVAALLKTVEAGGDVSSFGSAGQAVVELAELRAALRLLAGRPPDLLARLLGETLDVAAHRLDAWLTAVATQRLRVLRAARPEGLHLGGYGVVVDLRKRAGGPGTEGYLHVPSPGQAATAAVLRSGYLAHAGDPIGGTLALDLTSRRVRDATELAEGVRAGHPLGALLGARFERSLLANPAAGLGRYLPALRQLAPLVAGKREPLPAGVPVDAAAATDVVDGLALLQAAAPGAASPIPWGSTPAGASAALPARTDPDGAAIDAAIEELQDAVDAIGDVLLADAVHHAVTGNPAAAGGSLDVLAGGELSLPEPELTRTPLGGIGVTHRILLTLPEPATVPELANWAAKRPRALAEPRLNAWVAAVLGDPAAVRWTATWPQAGLRREYTLDDLGLCPLDVLALADSPVAATETPSTRPEARTDAERLLARHAATDPPVGAAGPLLLDLQPDPAWPADTLAMPDLVAVAAAAGELIGGARPATAADLAGPRGLRPTDAADLTDVTTAAKDAADSLDTAVADLRAAADPEAVRNALADLAGYGLPHAAPASPGGAMVPEDPDEVAALTEQVESVGAEADRRLATARSAHAAGDPVGALHAVFGPAFTPVPPCTAPSDPAGTAGGELAAGLAARVAAGDADAGVVGAWLESVAAVRSGVARLADVRLLADAVATGGGSPATQLRVAQLPTDSGGWVAQADPSGPPPAGVVSLTLAGPEPDPTKPVAALLVDDWVEVVPATRQDTAVVFQLDAPGACAPQAILLAVAPDPHRRWTADAVEQVVLDTVQLARLRAVDLDLPGTPPAGSPPAGHFLPALLLARNSGGDPFGDTVTTELPR